MMSYLGAFAENVKFDFTFSPKMLKQSETYSYEDNAKFKKILENVGYNVFCIYK